MVADREKAWIGLEYFCDEEDAFWGMSDEGILALAKREAAELGIAAAEDIEDGVVIRMPKVYPAYWGTYGEMAEARLYLDRMENLFLLGRNGTHRHNNQDDSMLMALTMVDQIVAGKMGREELWSINTDAGYQEER
jgi:protoporphyrinogen oxidase